MRIGSIVILATNLAAWVTSGKTLSITFRGDPQWMVAQEWTMDDQLGSDTPKKGIWQHRLHTWAVQSLVREVWDWVRCKDVTLPNVRRLAESIAVRSRAE